MACEDHQMLAAVIKGVHEKLRKEYQLYTNQCDELWDKHCEDREILQQYADAMHLLATTYWEQNNTYTRITWCHNVCRNYYRNGGIERAVQKDLKRASNCCGCYKSLRKQQFSTSPYKLRLLDVGSCYGPFNHFDDYLAVSVDLCPAIKEVLQCDFLKIQITEFEDEDVDVFLRNLCSPVKSLPSCCFHVVVFSLLLEYLPSIHQRWLCCKKAYDLLLPNGLLLIITPDSKHINHNSAMMKCWKVALEHLGFRRLQYEKQPHLHCMAYRKSCTTEIHDYVCKQWRTSKIQLLNKIAQKEKSDRTTESLEGSSHTRNTFQKTSSRKAENFNLDFKSIIKCPCGSDNEFEYLLFIPQDFNDYKTLQEIQKADNQRTEEEDKSIKSYFEELPSV